MELFCLSAQTFTNPFNNQRRFFGSSSENEENHKNSYIKTASKSVKFIFLNCDGKKYSQEFSENLPLKKNVHRVSLIISF